MKVLIVYPHFWPDTAPFGTMLKTICGDLQKAGFSVTVYTAQPSYRGCQKAANLPKEQYVDGVRVIRTRLFKIKHDNKFLRLIRMLMFLLCAFMHGLRNPYDVYWTGSLPPVLSGWIMCLCAKLKKAKFIYHLQDIHPEIAVLGKMTRTGSPIEKLMRLFDKYTLKHADRIVTLSEDMKEALAHKGADTLKIEIINNISLDEGQSEMPDVSLPKSARSPLRLIFAGNLGRFQGLDLIIDAAKLLKDDNGIQFIFVGNGVAKHDIIKWSGDLLNNTVFLYPAQSPAAIKPLIAECDIGLVSLKPEVSRYAYPSKIMSYLEQGTAILAIVDKDSSIERDILDNALGYVSHQRTAEDLAQTIRKIKESKADLRNTREHRCTYFKTHFSSAVICQKWIKLLKDI